jgi:hypothetical protein
MMRYFSKNYSECSRKLPVSGSGYTVHLYSKYRSHSNIRAELSTQWQNVFISGLDLNANATFTDGKVLENTLAPANVGKIAPRLPKQLYKAVATYHVNNNLTLSLAGPI